MIMDGKLYYVSDDGSYHKLCKIKELEETIMVDDESMFLHKEDPATVRSLRESGYFEASIDFDHIDSKVFEVFADVDKLIKKHQEYVELAWICELAKRYIVANSLKNLDTIEHLSELRSEYNCFDEKEEPYYRALSEAIGALNRKE